MSIILKGLDIPKDHSVLIEIDEHGEVCEHVKCDQVVHIEPWAKAIQIPKGHGRLIEEHYPGELQAKQPKELFIMYRSADEDSNRFILEAEAER